MHVLCGFIGYVKEEEYRSIKHTSEGKDRRYIGKVVCIVRNEIKYLIYLCKCVRV